MTAPFHSPWRYSLGWIAVSISTAALSVWSYWGSIEAFYEGWHYRSFWMNIGLTLGQYLLPVLILLAAAAAGVLWPRFGAALHLALAAWVCWQLNTRSGRLLIAAPLAGLATLYSFARIRSRRRALYIVCGVPAAILLASGAPEAYRVAHRVDDGFRGSRVVEGRDVRLRWAPAGPGWPERGGDWHKARDACASLSADGATMLDRPQNIWRLPTADELTRSLALHGTNAGGVWEEGRGPTYRMRPDKESPLWDPYSPVIYWWTASETGAQRAWRFSYNGRAMATNKSAGPAYYGFRCVTQP